MTPTSNVCPNNKPFRIFKILNPCSSVTPVNTSDRASIGPVGLLTEQTAGFERLKRHIRWRQGWFQRNTEYKVMPCKHVAQVYVPITDMNVMGWITLHQLRESDLKMPSVMSGGGEVSAFVSEEPGAKSWSLLRHIFISYSLICLLKLVQETWRGRFPHTQQVHCTPAKTTWGIVWDIPVMLALAN